MNLDETSLVCEAHSVPAALLHINAEPDDKRRDAAEREQEREAFPVVLWDHINSKHGEHGRKQTGAVNHSLDDVRPDHARCPVGQTEEPEKLVAESGQWHAIEATQPDPTILSNPGGVSSAVKSYQNTLDVVRVERQLTRHHGLREGVVRCLEESKHNIICPVQTLRQY